MFLRNAFLAASVTLAASSTTFSAYASGEQEEPRVEHYEASTPDSAHDLLRQYYGNVAIVGYILNNTTLSHADLEAIHEVSYSIEEAVEHAEAHKIKSSIPLKELAQQVEKLHHASEDHQEDAVRTAFAKITEAKLSNQ